ncbi:MAG: VWA domain-containing protein [Gemmatimonadota bacterium]|nr:VWA domain-containing protein [Gemmatimonadota bacterium]
MISAERMAELCAALRAEGLGCALTEARTALDASARLDTAEREEVRLGLRAAFCHAREDLEVFDRCFARWWTGEGTGPERRRTAARTVPRPAADARGSDLPRRPAPSGTERDPDDDRGPRETPAPLGTAYSPLDSWARRPFAALSRQEMREFDAWIDRLVFTLSTRRSRRLEPGGRRGPIDVRRTMRSAVRHDGELLRLVRRRRREEPPRLVVLCDVSGSMERYSRFLVRFLLGCGRTSEIETFAFSTRLVHLTPWLARTDLDDALARLRARGWSSGTRIGASLETFVRRYGTRMLGRRTIVIILSDGLDQGEAEELEEAMRRIGRRARRVIWLNPLLESSRYAPEARGMKAALPYVDHFHSGHSMEALEALPGMLRL